MKKRWMRTVRFGHPRRKEFIYATVGKWVRIPYIRVDFKGTYELFVSFLCEGLDWWIQPEYMAPGKVMKGQTG